MAKLFNNILQGCFGSKDKIRGCDYRLSIIIIYKNLEDKLPEDIKELLLTLIEISQHCYASADSRTPKFILRLHNISFKHALRCVNSLSQQNIITKQKLYGIYFHALTAHLPQQSRIVAPSCLHTEDEERLFSSINQIGVATSSRRPGSIRDNNVIRLQAEQNLKVSQIDNVETKIEQFSNAVCK